MSDTKRKIDEILAKETPVEMIEAPGIEPALAMLAVRGTDTPGEAIVALVNALRLIVVFAGVTEHRAELLARAAKSLQEPLDEGTLRTIDEMRALFEKSHGAHVDATNVN